MLLLFMKAIQCLRVKYYISVLGMNLTVVSLNKFLNIVSLLLRAIIDYSGAHLGLICSYFENCLIFLMTLYPDTFDITLTVIQLKKIGSMFFFARDYFEERCSLFEGMYPDSWKLFNFIFMKFYMNIHAKTLTVTMAETWIFGMGSFWLFYYIVWALFNTFLITFCTAWI